MLIVICIFKRTVVSDKDGVTKLKHVKTLLDR